MGTRLKAPLTIGIALTMLHLYGGVALGDDWQASWIGPSDEAQVDRRNAWYCFRETLKVGNQKPDEFPVRIACDSKYWLWVNGEQAVLEGGLKRGPSPTGTYFDRVDLAPFLTSGDNAVAILVWHFGKHGFSHNDSGKVGLIVDGSGGGLSLHSDSSWRVLRYPAFENAADPSPNYRLPEGNIRFDARKAMPGWQTKAGVDDWPQATEFGTAGTKPWGELVERPILPWKDFGVRDYVEIVETTADQLFKRSRLISPDRIKNASKAAEQGTEPDQRKVLVGVLPYNCHVHPILSITAPAGLKIDIQSDLLTNGRDYFLRAEYITREGKQEFELPGWMNGHEVRYFLPKEAKVHALRYRETGYNAEFVGTFACDDPRLNALWEKSRRTLYVTMRDTYMDCPDRERAQWWGDAVNEIGEAFYVFDAVKGPMLARKGILELAAWQRDDKTLYSPVPAGIPPAGTLKDNRNGTWSMELPRQMLASVGFYGFWHYYWCTGDEETIRTVYPAVRDYLSVWKLDERGLVKHRTGEWDWTDWGENKDVAVLENAWFHLALRGAAKMAELLGKPEDAARYRNQMEQIEGGFNKTFWQGEFYRSRSHEGETDDRANALAVVAGLALPEYYPAITRFLRTNMHASPYMEKYVLEAFFLMREPEAGIERMLARYTPMIECPETTLWENFAPQGSSRPGSGTYNHAWSGGPLTMMHQYIAGIEPTAPGFKRFSVKPQLGPLKKVETTVPTPYGKIKVTARRKGSEKLALKLIVPRGTTAEVEVGGDKKTFEAGTHSWTTPL
jgi:hypothetical protein